MGGRLASGVRWGLLHPSWRGGRWESREGAGRGARGRASAVPVLDAGVPAPSLCRRGPATPAGRKDTLTSTQRTETGMERGTTLFL